MRKKLKWPRNSIPKPGFFSTDFCPSPTNGFARFLSLGKKILEFRRKFLMFYEKILLFLLENYNNLPDFRV